jgi:hypothetical protein
MLDELDLNRPVQLLKDCEKKYGKDILPFKLKSTTNKGGKMDRVLEELVFIKSAFIRGGYILNVSHNSCFAKRIQETALG